MIIKDNPLWKQGATPEERKEIERIDKELVRLRKQTRALSVERNLLANRALVRARYEAGKAAIAAVQSKGEARVR